ncbi:type II secretory protein PulK [Pseudomonas agarici]|uniref:Type II secretion system protein K n=2 Tax=Pseudomonas agarici TaxID=46677 RepID=A0A0X1T8F9_PSEAA|nr:type II secretion system protein GspK [Pseudomonas agarici]AMB88364.1 type II secretory protein PulK [Pseudomonas agarici]NWB90849.1 general secretion pathway protein GspK [Pseudomonas agarici]NWC11803.1 general secretion pathway protein GspK [Pseudomonas agarici]
MPMPQRGVALISVLLIMALALLLTAGLLRSHRLTLHSSAQHIHQVQLRQWALAVEDWAGQLLHNPQLAATQNINLSQEWARQPVAFNIPDAQVRLEIEDLAGRFNLTPLLRPGKADEIILARWARLLELLEIPAIDLTPLRGTEVSDPSQLRLIPGVDRTSLQRLLPWIALLPGDATLNINTAGVLLLSTLEGVAATEARTLIQQRPAEGYLDAGAFALVSGLQGRGIASHGLGVGSRWFRVTVDVSAGRNHLRLVSDLERDPKTHRMRVVQRRFPAPTHSEPPS